MARLDALEIPPRLKQMLSLQSLRDSLLAMQVLPPQKESSSTQTKVDVSNSEAQTSKVKTDESAT